MSRDRLGGLLSELPVPTSAPARERAVAAARREIESTAPARPHRPDPYRRNMAFVLAACLACLVGVSLLTPPGQAAIDRVGRLLGIGQVGGAPTLEPRLQPRNRPVVVDNGRAPDGTRYEWSAYRGGQLHEGGPIVRAGQFCVGFDWPAVPARGRPLYCSAESGRLTPSVGARIADGFSIGYVQAQAERERDVLLMGTTRPDVHRLRILYRDRGGRRHELAVDFARIDGALLQRAGAKRPFGVFVAFMTAQQTAHVRLPKSLGAIVFAARRPPASAYPKGWPKACTDIPPPPAAPFELIAYDATGRRLARARTVVSHRPPAACVRALRKLRAP
jgi:hypothetical protein